MLPHLKCLPTHALPCPGKAQGVEQRPDEERGWSAVLLLERWEGRGWQKPRGLWEQGRAVVQAEPLGAVSKALSSL